MADLSPKARALIQEGRPAFRASAADRARIDAALRARLGPLALPNANGVGWASGVWKGIAVGLCVLGGAAFWALRPIQTQQTAPSAATSSSAMQPSAAAPAELPTPAPAENIARTPARATPPSVREHDELAREVALLARATKELHAGNARKALNTLETHRRKFPNGSLAEERRAATAQALCALGRVSEGRAEQARLAPNSPAASRAKQLCDAAEEHE